MDYIFKSKISNILKQMIKKESGYYYCVDEQPADELPPSPTGPPSPLPFEIVGDIKGYLMHVGAEIAQIKQLKLAQKREQLKNKLILQDLNQNNSSLATKPSNVNILIAIPPQIYELDERISGLQKKFINNQIIRQKMQKRGKLSQRAKRLKLQLQKLSERPPQSIAIAITKYTKNLDEKQEQQKILFLYEAFTKTSSLGQQIDFLDQYLSNLNQIMTKFKALPLKESIVDNHNKILEVREKNRERIRQLYQYMKDQYQKVVKDLQTL